MAQASVPIHDLEKLEDILKKYQCHKRVEKFLVTLQQVKQEKNSGLETSMLKQFLEEMKKPTFEISQQDAQAIRDAVYGALIGTSPPGMAQASVPIHDLNKLEDILKNYQSHKRVNKFLETLQQVKEEKNSGLETSMLKQFLEEMKKPTFEISQQDAQVIGDAVYGALIGTSPPTNQIGGKMSRTVGSNGGVKSSTSQSLSKTTITVTKPTQQPTTAKQSGSSPQMAKRVGIRTQDQQTAWQNQTDEESQMETEESAVANNPGSAGNRVDESNEKLKAAKNKLSDHIERLQRELDQKKEIIQNFETTVNEAYGENQNLMIELENMKKTNEELGADYGVVHVENEQRKKRIVHLEEHFKAYEKTSNERLKALVAERDDLRNRYSKLAGQKLKDNNPDISDLNDPNRPLKLGEKFSELYDNEWTDIFQAQVDTLKKSEKDAITFLLNILEECYGRCKPIAENQVIQLRNIFLYHCQDVSKAMTQKDKPRLHSSEEKSLLEVRKMIASNNVVPVKEAVLPNLMKKLTKGDEKVKTEFKAYFERCIEVCWLLAINDPPLFMETDVKPGSKVDGNLYTTYYQPGDKADFLVWPPLLNGPKGGLINKGVIAPVKERKKTEK